MLWLGVLVVGDGKFTVGKSLVFTSICENGVDGLDFGSDFNGIHHTCKATCMLGTSYVHFGHRKIRPFCEPSRCESF